MLPQPPFPKKLEVLSTAQTPHSGLQHAAGLLALGAHATSPACLQATAVPAIAAQQEGGGLAPAPRIERHLLCLELLLPLQLVPRSVLAAEHAAVAALNVERSLAHFVLAELRCELTEPDSVLVLWLALAWQKFSIVSALVHLLYSGGVERTFEDVCDCSGAATPARSRSWHCRGPSTAAH